MQKATVLTAHLYLTFVRTKYGARHSGPPERSQIPKSNTILVACHGRSGDFVTGRVVLNL
jgi:hypothetical protein